MSETLLSYVELKSAFSIFRWDVGLVVISGGINLYTVLRDLMEEENWNERCSVTKECLMLFHRYHIRRRLLLTSIPIQNSLQELWALLNFLLPRFGNHGNWFYGFDVMQVTTLGTHLMFQLLYNKNWYLRFMFRI